jgi:hypothetical protein
MTVATRSAYPAPVEELMPAARALATELGPDFSRNKLMKRLRIGDEKAKEIIERLDAEATSTDPAPEPAGTDQKDPDAAGEELSPQPTAAVAPEPSAASKSRPWWLVGLVAPAFVAIWSGWVGLGGLTGFGPVHLLPGIADDLTLNTAITLPIGMETYAAYALRVWLTPGLPARARTFARKSAIGSLLLGASGQIAFHLMTAAHIDHAPWWITTLVACIPVGVLGMGAALAHLLRNGDTS